jgi:hypothetical protein
MNLYNNTLTRGVAATFSLFKKLGRLVEDHFQANDIYKPCPYKDVVILKEK